MICYITLLAIIITKHEPWRDEAQSWLIARDANPVELFTRYLRYEGHPFLWYLILMIPAKLGLPYITMSIISAAIAGFSVYLILWHSPFPNYIKVLIPFSFLFFYQFAVVARSYVLIPLLLFFIAMIYKEKMERFYLFIVLLCLLANVSLHGILIAVALLFIHALELSTKWSTLSKPLKKKQIIGYLIFFLVMIFIAITLWPPSDISPSVFIRSALTPGQSLNGSMTNIWYFSLIALVTILLWIFLRGLTLEYVLPTISLMLFFSIVYYSAYHAGILFFLLIFVLWLSFSSYEKHMNKAHLPLVDVCGRCIIAYAFAGILLTQAPLKLALIPVYVCVIILLPIVIYFMNRDGYITIEQAKTKQFIYFKGAAILAIIMVLLFQVGWTVKSFCYDFRNNYSGARSVADYIKRNHLDSGKISVIDASGAISILPYFSHNIFHNYNGGNKNISFWVFSKENADLSGNTRVSSINKITNDSPDTIIMFSNGVQPIQIDDYEPAYRSIGVTSKYFQDESFFVYRRLGPESKPSKQLLVFVGDMELWRDDHCLADWIFGGGSGGASLTKYSADKHSGTYCAAWKFDLLRSFLSSIPSYSINTAKSYRIKWWDKVVDSAEAPMRFARALFYGSHAKVLGYKDSPVVDDKNSAWQSHGFVISPPYPKGLENVVIQMWGSRPAPMEKPLLLDDISFEEL